MAADDYYLSIGEVQLAAICDGVRARVFESRGPPNLTASLPEAGAAAAGGALTELSFAVYAGIADGTWSCINLVLDTGPQGANLRGHFSRAAPFAAWAALREVMAHSGGGAPQPTANDAGQGANFEEEDDEGSEPPEACEECEVISAHTTGTSCNAADDFAHRGTA